MPYLRSGDGPCSGAFLSRLPVHNPPPPQAALGPGMHKPYTTLRERDSRSPSTMDGQPLELMYYARVTGPSPPCHS